MIDLLNASGTNLSVIVSKLSNRMYGSIIPTNTMNIHIFSEHKNIQKYILYIITCVVIVLYIPLRIHLLSH